MSDLLCDKVRLDGNVLGVCQDGSWANMWLEQVELNALRWMVTSESETTFSRKTDNWEVFIGPYIKGSETGYIFQAISLHSRDVVTATVPFRDGVDVKLVKQALREMLLIGGNTDGEEEKEEVH